MSKIYADYDDKFVKNTIVYVKDVNSSMTAFKDEACTEEYTSEELFDAYLKGVLVTIPEENEYYTKYYNTITCMIDQFGTSMRIWDGYDTHHTIHAHKPNPNLEG